jgi:hypothetical protein
MRSKHKAMSYRRMAAAEAALEAETGAWLAQAEAADAAEDAAYGAERRGDETPDWGHDQQRRRAQIRAAQAALEAGHRRSAAPRALVEARRTRLRRAGRRSRYRLRSRPSSRSSVRPSWSAASVSACAGAWTRVNRRES